MKPNFALKLSHDGVEILQRAASGWIVTGSARFDSPDLDGVLRRLRAQAETLAPEGMRSKLILPESEVRYATVVAPGPTDEARRLQVEAEIERLTPYALHELAYDYVVEGDHALVAICARETLAEAETFAQTHGFNPVSFAAIPASGAFSGEPFFGETSGARAFLSRNTSVERDSEPVRIVPPVRPAEAAAPAPRPATPAPTPPPAARPTTGAAPSGKPAVSATSTAGGPDAAAAEPFSRVGNLVRRMGTRIRREQAAAVIPAETKATAAPRPGAMPPALPAGSGVPASQGKAEPAPIAKPADTKSGGAKPAGAKPVGAKPAEAKPTEAKPTPARPAASKPTTPAATKSPAGAFSSRRSAPVAAAPVVPADAKRPAPASDSAGPRPAARKPEPPADGASEGPSRMRRLYRRSRRAAKSALARVGLAEAPKGRGKRRDERKKAADLQKPLVPASAPPINEREKASEEAAMTIFGARNMQRTDTGFARRGLMLTGGLLLLLAAVAIWALYFTGGSGREADLAQAPQGETASLPPIDAPAQAPGPEAAGADIIAPAPIAAPPEDMAEDTPEDAPADAIAAPDDEALSAEAEAEAPGPITDPDALLEELVQEALTEALPADLLQPGEDVGPLAEDAPAMAPGPTDEGTPGATESPQVIPETGEPDQRLALPPVLERPQLVEVAPVSPPPPPPFGAEFELGPDGLVEATPEGALTPSGVTVYAAPPAVVPPARPAGIAPAEALPDPVPEAEAEAGVDEPEAQLLAPEATPATTEAVAEALAEALGDTAETPTDALDETTEAIAADPALAGIRPQPRSPRVAELAAQAAAQAEDAAPAPEDAPAPVEPADPDDDSAAAPSPGGVLLDGLRPQRRPTDLVAPTQTAEAPEETEDAPGVVTVSLRPTARPGDLSARVQESLAAARSPAPAAAAAAAPAAAAPAASAAPNIPTSASVAQQATQTRALNLRRVNLIGVFGTPNARRALVRLSNGQVVRVQVGDRLDGGQVSAIGDHELRYVKNGRNEVLRIGSSG